MFEISSGSAVVVSLETRFSGIFDGLSFIIKIEFIPFQVLLILSQSVLK